MAEFIARSVRFWALATGFGVLATVTACDTAAVVGEADAALSDGGARDAAFVTDAGPGAPECEAGCLVGDVCYPDGVASPTNPCEICDTDSSRTGFSPNDGAVCDDGSFCTSGDRCDLGVCTGAPRTCADGIECNGAEVCDEASAACVAGVPTCAGGELCNAVSGACVSECPGCSIDGVCYGDGQISAFNPCERCDVASSRTSWSDNDGASCDDGSFCTTGDACSAGACTGSAPRACSDGVSCNGDETCDETAGACVSATGTCAVDEICDVASDACIATCTGCVIGGVCTGEGQRNPANPCEVCSTSVSATSWTANDGASCDDGLFCTAGDTCSGTTCGGAARVCSDGVTCNGGEACDESADACITGASTCAAGTLCEPTTDSCVTTCSGCVIGGSCYGAGQSNPSNPCEVCAVATSRTAWSPNDGARCDDGAFCTDGDVCLAGACAGSTRTCADGVACNGAESCNETENRCDPGAPTCGAGQVCDTIADRCETTCGGCVIGGVCYAALTTNPTNPCQVCRPLTSSTSWTADAGASCDDGLYCTTGETCSATAACTGGTARSCADGVTCNGTESCDEASDRCNPGVPTCAAGQVCNTSTNACIASCGTGLTECSSSCVDTTYDPANCGACGTSCAAAANATAACVSSGCRVFCDAGFGDCGGDAACETDLRVTPSNCGVCGNACATGEFCSNGICEAAKRVFITSTAYVVGSLGGLAGADARCQMHAAAAGLPGTYMAWLSDSTGSPSTRFTRFDGIYERVDGVQIADGWADLTDGSIDNPISVNELGGPPPPAPASLPATCSAVSNTNVSGGLWSASLTCGDYTSTAGGLGFADPYVTGDRWTTSCSGGSCEWALGIYCFQQ